jgi:hypothetical protein
MNRQMNLPALQRIAMEFEKENDIMDQRQEMMDDAIDDVTGLEDEEEGEEVVNQVLDEIGIDLGQSVRDTPLPKPVSITDMCSSSERLLQACKSLQSQKAGWRKRSVDRLMQVTMIFRPVWTACEDKTLNDRSHGVTDLKCILRLGIWVTL